MSGQYDLSYKVLLLGDSGVGKSTILQQYYTKEFDPNFITTIGIDFSSQIVNVQDKKIRLALWDTAGQERFRAITKSYLHDCNAIIFVYDITNRKTFDNINSWIRLATEYSTGDNILYFIVGNKLDQNKSREVTQDELISLATAHKCGFYETTATLHDSTEALFYLIAKSLSENVIPAVPNNITLVDNQQRSYCCQ
jgi:small GTP-binding protein